MEVYTRIKGLFLIFILPVSVWGAIPAPDFSFDPPVQLVQSVPAETDLAQPGVATTEEVWLDMIKNAKLTIDLAQFYLSSQPKASQSSSSKSSPNSSPNSSNDKKAQEKNSQDKKTLEPVIEELEKASKRGVRIRLLISRSLIHEDPQTLERIKKLRGVSIHVYDLSQLTGGVHHAKYWIVDRKDVFVGSQNFDWRSLNQIHELGVRVQDTDVARELTRIFELDWGVSKTEQFPPAGIVATSADYPISANTKKVELVASPPNLNPADIRPAIQALVELIQEAKKVIRVQLMDYSPVSGSQVYWPDLDNALRAAALRGVKVQMMVSNAKSSARAIDYLKSLSMIPGVEIKMVTIPVHSGGPIPYARMIHSKYMVIDDQIFWVGTSNWSKGYFYNSRNVELIFHRNDLAQTANQIFQRIWNYPYAEKVEIAKPKL